MAARRLATQIEEYFTPEVEFWEHEKLLGGGSWGIAILLKEKEHKFGKPLRIVIKVGSSLTGQAQLRLEMDRYKMINGAKHIIRMLGCVEDRNPNESANRFPPLEFAFRAILPINGPILALEYLDGGDSTWFFGRMKDNGVRPPNRILWSMFLCLIRACIGMAFPIGASIFQESILEEVPTSGAPTNIRHNDIHPRNVMLASGDHIDEHGMGTLFKIIDFGASDNREGFSAGSADNIREISQFMLYFITMIPSVIFRPGIYRGEQTAAGVILHTPPAENPYPWLDPQLAGLLAECQYYDASKRPGLEQLLARAKFAVLNKVPESFPEPEYETDEYIRDFHQRSVTCSLTTSNMMLANIGDIIGTFSTSHDDQRLGLQDPPMGLRNSQHRKYDSVASQLFTIDGYLRYSNSMLPGYQAMPQGKLIYWPLVDQAAEDM
ncbi:hypothetical protein F5X98DRAFT_380902 [Xylaria grammica]|nr:hypothetical protein F5X98DRAFT_380902 [Xylaria grammica]